MGQKWLHSGYTAGKVATQWLHGNGANNGKTEEDRCTRPERSPGTDRRVDRAQHAVEIAITLEDQDQPDFVHWVMSGIDPFATSLAEGAVPEFAIVGLNGRGQPGYTGPCPPVGETHTYVYTVHFLDQATELADGAPGADLQAFVKGATFESRTISGTYSQG